MPRFVQASTVALLIAVTGIVTIAQGRPAQTGLDRAAVVVPDTSVPLPGDVGVNAHTNHLIDARPMATGTAPAGETPASLRSVYALPSAGGTGTIVIVDAFDYPTALADFNTFSTRFGLRTEPSVDAFSPNNTTFQVVYANGRRPRSNCGWAQEAALDIEWAHAMAPDAKIVLVEAASNSFADLFVAVDAASRIGGARQVSMSWGGSEFSSEATNDKHFGTTGVTYVASSGDTGGTTIYPGVSPNVVSAGGTRVNRDGSGNFISETGWSGSGGGRSKYEPRPFYQDVIFGSVGNSRGVPDYSFDADPKSGVSVYDSTSCQGQSGWMVFGGTSVSAPSLAGILNLAGSATSTQDLLSTIYANVTNGGATINGTNFRDVLSGTAGSFTATGGWDFVTGVGSTQGLGGK